MLPLVLALLAAGYAGCHWHNNMLLWRRRRYYCQSYEDTLKAVMADWRIDTTLIYYTINTPSILRHYDNSTIAICYVAIVPLPLSAAESCPVILPYT